MIETAFVLDTENSVRGEWVEENVAQEMTFVPFKYPLLLYYCIILIKQGFKLGAYGGRGTGVLFMGEYF